MRYVLIVLFTGLLGVLPLQAAPSVKELGTLVTQLKSGDAKVQQKAAARLAALKDPRSVPLLAPLCRVPLTTVVACNTLARIGGKGIDVLLQLRGDKTHWIRMQAVRGLCVSNDPRARTAVRGMLKDADAELRAAAIHTMVNQPHSVEKVKLLLPLLQDKNETCRREAIFALESSVKMRDAAVLDALYRLANTATAETRDLALKVLIPLNDQRLLPALSAWLQEADPDHARRAAHALGQLGDPSVVPLYGQVLERWIAKLPPPGQPLPDEYPERAIPNLTSGLTEGLANIGDATALDLLYGLTSHAHPLVRKQSMRAFLQVADPRGPQVMAAAILDPDADVRFGNIQLAYHFTDDPAVRNALLRACTDTDPRTRYLAMERAVFDTPEQAFTVLDKALVDDDGMVQAMAAVRLGGMKDTRAVDRLLTMLDAADPKTHRLAILGLGHANDAHAEEALLTLLQKKGEPRVQVVLALQGSMNPRVIHAVLGLLPGADVELRYMIYMKFEVAPTPLATDALQKALVRETDDDLKSMLLRGLEAIGNVKAADALLAIVNDVKQAKFHQQALYALGRTRDARALPVLLARLKGKGDNWGAVRGMGAYGGPQAYDALLPHINHASSYTRTLVLSGLGKTGDARAVPVLIAALQRSDLYDRYAAIEGLRLLGKDKAQAAIDPLIAALARAKTLDERISLARSLTALTGQTLGTDPAAWRAGG